MPNEEGDVVKEYKAIHEEDFWTNWLREEEKSKEERKAEAEGKEEEKVEKRKREEEKEAFEIFESKRRDSNGNTLWRSLRTCLTVSLCLVSWCVLCLM